MHAALTRWKLNIDINNRDFQYFIIVSRQAFDRSIMPGDGDEPFTASGTPDDAQGGGPDVKPVRRFTWRERSKLNEPHNAHVAVRGKVGNTFRIFHSHDPF